MSTCTRWLLPINESHWFLSAAGRKLHFAPEATSNRVYTWAGCGTRVDVARSKVHQTVGPLSDRYALCARCIDRMTGTEYLLEAELKRLRNDTKKLVAAVMSLIDKDSERVCVLG